MIISKDIRLLLCLVNSVLISLKFRNAGIELREALKEFRRQTAEIRRAQTFANRQKKGSLNECM